MSSSVVAIAVATAAPVWAQNSKRDLGEYESIALPAMALRLVDPSGERPETTISMVAVDESQESRVFQTLAEATANEASDPTIVIAKQGGHVDKELKALSHSADRDRRLAPVILSQNDVQLAERAGRIQGGLEETSQFTLQGMNRAGWWIAISVTGIYSLVFYLSSDLGPFASASAFVLALQIINAQWPNFYPKTILGTGARLAGNGVELARARGFPISQKAGEEVGRIFSALAYSFIVNSGFKLALSWFDLGATFGSLETLANTASNAVFGFISTDVWNVFVSRNLNEVEGDFSNPGPGEERFLMANRMLMFTRQIVSASMGPFLYFASTHDMAITVLGVVGVFGLAANLYGKPFIKTADFVLSKMEKSKNIGRILSKMLHMQEKVSDTLSVATSPLRSALRTCSGYFSEQ